MLGCTSSYISPGSTRQHPYLRYFLEESNDTPCPLPHRSCDGSIRQQLYGFTDKGAVEVMSTAEVFVADAKGRNDISDNDKALQARRHSQDTVDIVAGKHDAHSSLHCQHER